MPQTEIVAEFVEQCAGLLLHRPDAVIPPSECNQEIRTRNAPRSTTDCSTIVLIGK